MSSFEGLAHLPDHHRLFGFNVLHRRSDSVESHGSVSSLSSNQSNNGYRGPVTSSMTAEASKYGRFDTPKMLNAASPMRNASMMHHSATPKDTKLKLSIPQMTLLHSTSVMEAPVRQQTLNRSRSGSCPIVWTANGSQVEQQTNGWKQRHMESNYADSSSFVHSPRQSEYKNFGPATSSVRYGASHYDGRYAMDSAKISQVSSKPMHSRCLAPTYDRMHTDEMYSTNNGLTDLVQSPIVVTSSLQRSLSTMSVNVAPSSNFTSRFNCSLSRSHMSRLNDVLQTSEENGSHKIDKKNGRLASSQQSLCEFGINYNVQEPGRVWKLNEAYDKGTCIRRESSVPCRDTPRGNKDTPFGNRNASIGNRDTPLGNKDTPLGNKDTHLVNRDTFLGNREQYKYRSYENIGPTKYKFALSALNPDEKTYDNSANNSRSNGLWNQYHKSVNGIEENDQVNCRFAATRSKFETAGSDKILGARSMETITDRASRPQVMPKSTFVSEMYVNIVKPSLSNNCPSRDCLINFQLLGKKPAASVPFSPQSSSDSSSSGVSDSRASFPSTVTADTRRASCERAPLAAAASSNRRHSNPATNQKVHEMSPDIKAHVTNQREHMKVLLHKVNNMCLYRERLRACVAKLEEKVHRQQKAAAEQFPTTYDVQKMCEINQQLRTDVQQLTHEVDMASMRHRGGIEMGRNERGTWSCSACTFINHHALDICECCELPRLPFVIS